MPRSKKPTETIYGIEITKPFSREMYDHNNMVAEEMKANGERTSEELYEFENSSQEFTTTAGRIMEIINSIPGENNYLQYDATTKSYIAKALNNYVRDKVLSPRIKNSLAARMRPYTLIMQEKFPELNNDKLAQKKWKLNADEIFYLGDYY